MHLKLSRIHIDVDAIRNYAILVWNFKKNNVMIYIYLFIVFTIAATNFYLF